MRELTGKLCDRMARIPAAGAFGSLNVSNAAAVALYAAARACGLTITFSINGPFRNAAPAPISVGKQLARNCPASSHCPSFQLSARTLIRALFSSLSRRATPANSAFHSGKARLYCAP